jgi:hypothetical protein
MGTSLNLSCKYENFNPKKSPQNLMSLAHVFTKTLCEFGHQVVKIHQKQKHLLLIVEIIIF